MHQKVSTCSPESVQFRQEIGRNLKKKIEKKIEVRQNLFVVYIEGAEDMSDRDEVIEKMLKFDILNRERIITVLSETDDLRRLPHDVRDVIYSLYDYCQDVSYRMLDDIENIDDTIVEWYIFNYSTKFQEFVFSILGLYKLDNDELIYKLL